MPLTRLVSLAMLAWCLVESTPARAADHPAGPALPAMPALFKATRTFVSEAKLPIGVFDPAAEPALSVGDRAVAVVTLEDDSKSMQWVILLKVVPTSAEVAQRLEGAKPLILHTTTGLQLEYPVDFRVFQLTTVGPFEPDVPEPKKLRRRTAAATVNADNLLLGFDQACAAMPKLREARKNFPKEEAISLSTSTNRYPDTVTKKGRELADRMGLTLAEERALAATVPAFLGFFRIAETTPGLQEILRQVLDVPLWSILTRGGANPNFTMDAARVVRLSDSPAGLPRHLMPMDLQINGNLALHLNFVVVAPHSPYACTGGILEVRAQHPKNPNKRAFIQLLCARRAETASVATDVTPPEPTSAVP